MARFFLGQRVRVVGLEQEATAFDLDALGKEGVVNELDCVSTFNKEGMVGVTLPIPAYTGKREDWCFGPHHLEPILPDGHRASTESFQELLDRLNTKKVERVEEVGA